MGEIKKILMGVILLPSLPLVFFLMIYSIYKTYKENGVVETSMMGEKGLEDFTLKNIKHMYPYKLAILMGIVFYITLIMIFLK